MNDLFAAVYENDFIGFFSSGFSEEIYNLFLYQKYGLTLIISVLLGVLLYYKLMDKPRFAKLLYWLIVLLVTVVFNFVFLFTDARSTLEVAGFNFDQEYLSLAVVNALYAVILFCLLSVIVKFFSINTSKIPF